MSKRLLPILLSILLCLCQAICSSHQGTAEAADRVLAVQSFRIKPYEEALKGFRAACPQCEVSEIVASDMNGDDLLREIRGERPSLILAIGVDALAKLRRIKDIPIVYLMVPNPQSVIAKEPNITGVGMTLPPEKQLSALLEVLPGKKVVGLIYDPEKSGAFVKRAQAAAQSAGVTLVAREVRNSREVAPLIRILKNEIDVFWMIPDTTVFTPETVEALFLYSFDSKIPVFTFSDKYLETGALLSAGVDPLDIGRQAGEMARKILGDVDAANVPRTDPRRVMISINLKAARKLGVTISSEVIGRSRIVN